MKNKKTTLIVLTLSILICISTVSINVFSEENQITIQNKNYTGTVKTSMKIPTKTNSFIEQKEDTSFLSTTGNTDNLAVSSETGDESYPSMVINNNNLLVAYEYEYDDETHIYLRSSQDYGQTWSSSWGLNLESPYENINTTSPSVSIYPGSNNAFGSFISPYVNSGIFGYIDIPNIVGNKNTWEAYALDWSNITYNETSGEYLGFWDFSNPDTLCYDDDTTPWIIGVVGSTNYTDETTDIGECTQSPMFCFNDLEDPESYITLTWYPEFEGCSNLKIGNNYGSSDIFAVCEIENNTNQDVLFFKGNPNAWYYEESAFNYTFAGVENLINPDIFVNDNQIYVVVQTDMYTDQEIIIYNSSDGGENWTRNRVTETSSDSTNPVIFVNETHIACTYIENKNLSLIISDDNGVTWGTPTQINDEDNTVIEGYHNTDMSDMNHIVWTDDRNGNNDLYTIVMDLPTLDLSVSNVELVTGSQLLPTKNWISFTVQNNGNGVANGIHVTFSYECKNQTPVTIPYTVDISSINSYGQITKKETIFRTQLPDYFIAMIQLCEIENITVHVDPDKTTGDTNYNNNNATINVSYEDIFPAVSKSPGLMSLMEFLAGLGIF